MIAQRRFEGVVAGEVKQYRPGDKITTEDAEAMALASKPHLAKKEPKNAKPAKA